MVLTSKWLRLPLRRGFAMGDEIVDMLQALNIPEYAEAFAAQQWTMGALKVRGANHLNQFGFLSTLFSPPARLTRTARDSHDLRARAGSATRPAEAGPGWRGAPK